MASWDDVPWGDTMRRKGSARRATPVAKAVAKSLPSWDIDLGSVQDIRQVSLIITSGEVLLDAHVQIAAQPIGQDDAATWSCDVFDAKSDRHDIKVGALGRYIRVEAPRLMLDGVDVLLPRPSKSLDTTLSQDALTITDGGWQVPSLRSSDDNKGHRSKTQPKQQPAGKWGDRLVPPASFSATGKVQGVLRRPAATTARGRMLTRRAMVTLGYGGEDEIIFR